MGQPCESGELTWVRFRNHRKHRELTENPRVCPAQSAPAGGLALPAYDQCIKASHVFNLLDARGVISVTERASYIGRVRALAKGCCEAWLGMDRQAEAAE